MAIRERTVATGKDARQFVPLDEKVFLNPEKRRKEDLPTYVERKLEQERKRR